MNKEFQKICDILNNLYDKNPEFYKFIRDNADHLESYLKKQDVNYTSLVKVIIAMWESRRDEFWNKIKQDKSSSTSSETADEGTNVRDTTSKDDGWSCVI